MSHVAGRRVIDKEGAPSGWYTLYTVGGVAALLQLASVLGIMAVVFTLGSRPATAEARLAVVEESAPVALLRDDLFSLVLIGLYLGTFPGLCVALRRINPAATALSALFTFVVVAGALASHTGFAMVQRRK